MNICNTCFKNKEILEFHKNSNKCKICYSIYWKEYYNKNKDKVHLKNQAYYKKDPIKHRLRERIKGRLALGVTLPIETESCEICFTKPTKRALSLDHDHKLNIARGYLCSNCNTAIGLFKDRPELLLSAIKYLNRNK